MHSQSLTLFAGHRILPILRNGRGVVQEIEVGSEDLFVFVWKVGDTLIPMLRWTLRFQCRKQRIVRECLGKRLELGPLFSARVHACASRHPASSASTIHHRNAQPSSLEQTQQCDATQKRWSTVPPVATLRLWRSSYFLIRH
jgi:hypothetical protein